MGYVPAAYRGYPFELAESADGELMLVVDEDSGLVIDADTGINGEIFFDGEGNPAKLINDVLKFLVSFRNDRTLTQLSCKVLTQHAPIQPWPISIEGEAGGQKVEGLYCIDEGALNALSTGAFEDLRKGGALLIAYCQLLSMQHLGQLTVTRKKTAESILATRAGELDLEFLNDSGTLSFGLQ